MEISLHLYQKIVIIFHKKRPLQKQYKVNRILCRANSLAMQKGNTNFYEVLSLGYDNVGLNEIKKAYRSMALQYHPDVCPPSRKEESMQKFIEIQRAYETLSDPISRQNYDYELGLIDSIDVEIGIKQRDKTRSSFSKEMWERQLCELRRRSHDRMESKKSTRFM